MLLVYTHENKIIVENVRSLLEQNGIDTSLRNEYASGGMGELAPTETWPELWVNDWHFDKAKAILKNFARKELRPGWVCHNCGEENASTFDHCWNCQTEPERG